MRDLARSLGMQAPSLYNYFDSKNAIYDAMYAQGWQQLADAEPAGEITGDPLRDLQTIVHFFVEFCCADVARYQLLNQRTIPGFEPSAESFAISQRSLARLREHLERCGIDDPTALDLLTALSTGLADQQISNDPGGDRWIRLIDEVVEMLFNHMASKKAAEPARSARSAKGRRAR